MLFATHANPDDLTALPTSIDGIEWRLDLSRTIDPGRIASFLENAPCPVMLTLRHTSHGGSCLLNGTERESLIKSLLSLKPDYFDLEYDLRPDFIHSVAKDFPSTRLLLSYHKFDGVPDDLEALFEEMSQLPAFAYKIAIAPKTATEALECLLFSKAHSRLSIICMGENGSFARALGTVVSNVIDYAPLDGHGQTAPGQIPVDELVNVYRYRALNAATVLYGLIGNPVSHSRGHIHHNGVFDKRSLNAVYVKMKVDSEELGEFFPAARALGFRGLSVTMPLKEAVLEHLAAIDPKAAKIGAVNTLLFEHDTLYGTNTDCIGALDAIERHGPVAAKSVVILGAGGAAKAIAYEAKQRGADVTILNRTEEKARALAESEGYRWGGLAAIPPRYDVMVNSTSDPLSLDPAAFVKGSLAMDITYVPKETPFLKTALGAGCHVVYGEEMFIKQAEAQTRLWFDRSGSVRDALQHTKDFK